MVKKTKKKEQAPIFFTDDFFGNPEYDNLKCYVSRSARITGAVEIGDDVIVCPNVVLRADEGTPFKIGRGTNIQDGVIMHGLHKRYVTDDAGRKYSVLIGSHCTIAHGAIIHGPIKTGNKTFIGFRAIVHESEIGRNCHIGHGAIIEGVTIQDGRYVRSGSVIDTQELADNLPKVEEKHKEFNRHVVDLNKELRAIYHERRKLSDKLATKGSLIHNKSNGK